MKKFFLKRWFLLLLVVGLSLAAWMPRSLQPVVGVLEPKVIVSVALFLMAWCLESRHLLRTLLRPWPAVWAVLISYGLLPALAWTASLLLELADFRIGLMIAASVPCTLASAVLWTRMAHGNEATALLVTRLTTGTSCLAIHLIGLAFGFWSGRALRFDRPNQIAVAFGCSQKSLPVALFLYQTYAEAYPLAVIPLAIYHMGQLIVDTVIAERMADGGHHK